ncbi:ankyrin repeat domain-containing protein [Parapedobacter sp. DT-150]|uniref:ankyrin repeat domain-containing protein n=1 Tax=Parapedobacter sp. DT-150 TaxID=3396162 RepID=UPI003F1A0538
MDLLTSIIGEIELHAVEGIRRCFAQGVNPNDHFNGVPLIYELTSEYTRSPRFKDCVRAFVDHGLEFEDEALLAVLLDDAALLDGYIGNHPETTSNRYTLRCAYTPLYEATLLHICAEFNHVSCAEVLIGHGADVNARAGTDEDGFGGQTPVFHTVNQNHNQSMDVLNYLLSKGVDLKVTIPGIIWGKGYGWETLIPAVNPISYAMMGLLPQMHRDEVTISKVVTTLLGHAYGMEYIPKNVPCAYLKK